MVGVEVDVEVAGMGQQLGQASCVRREMRIRDEDAVLPNVECRSVKLRSTPTGLDEPPDDGARTRPGVQVVNVPEADTLISLVVEDHDGLDSAILENLDLRVSL